MTHTTTLIHGPNLNMLGKRDVSIYGSYTLEDIETLCKEVAENKNIELTCFSSNIEGEIIEFIHENIHSNAIIINAGAYTHTSIAIHDALQICENTIIAEVHLSNIYSREEFRHHSYISPIANFVICGAGIDGYVSAINIISKNL